jgi:thiol-disulfide isomerase/thioredoxin
MTERSLPPLALVVLVAAAVGAAPKPKEGRAALALEPQAVQQARLPYYPVQLPLSPRKPEGLKKEPQYRGAPKYATLRLGNVPDAPPFIIALDEPEGAEARIFVDVNHNGDLTDDGDGAWTAKRDTGRKMYGLNHYVLTASWEVGKRKRRVTGPYGLAFYRFPDLQTLLMYREAARTGTFLVDGKPHKVMLVENDADGVYAKPAQTAEEARKSRPVWLLIDMDDDGKFAMSATESFDVRVPFKLGEKTYEAEIPADGSQIALKPTVREVIDLSPKSPPPPLAAGKVAPDFKAEAWGGGAIGLEQFKGKVVVLDFWATWCGPCQKSMPHLQKVYESVKEQEVVVLALCVFDERDAYQKWVPENQSKYSFQFAFDPAGRSDNGIAAKLYSVTGIPTTFVIDRDGKVAATIVGYDDGDHRVEDALKKLGIQVPASAAGAK